MGYLEKTIAAAGLPVTVATAKDHSRITGSDEDDYIENLIRTAEDFAEQYTGRAILTSTFKYYLSKFPSVIVLPRSPLGSVSSITYIDEDGATQTLSSSVYDVHPMQRPYIARAYGESWPSTQTNMQAVTVEFTAGYGTAETDVPEGLRQALLFYVAHLYEHREPDVLGTIVQKIPNTLFALLNRFRLFEVR